MAGNRVEELETKVRELEATVSGLTDELVETKERLRFVEDELGQDVDALVEGKPSRRQARNDHGGRGRGRRRPEELRDEPRAEASAPEQASDETDADGAVAADEAKSGEAEGEEDGSEASDDIIVA